MAESGAHDVWGVAVAAFALVPFLCVHVIYTPASVVGGQGEVVFDSLLMPLLLRSPCARVWLSRRAFL